MRSSRAPSRAAARRAASASRGTVPRRERLAPPHRQGRLEAGRRRFGVVARHVATGDVDLVAELLLVDVVRAQVEHVATTAVLGAGSAGARSGLRSGHNSSIKLSAGTTWHR